MLLWIIQISIISIILIFVVQNLIYFFKSTLTVPKIKDLVNSPHQKYEAMFNIISSSQPISTSYLNNINNSDEYSTYIKPKQQKQQKQQQSDDYIQSLLPVSQSQSSMKNELKEFLKNKLKST
jgi:hypothetical protein